MENKTVTEILEEIEKNELKDMPPEQREAYIFAVKFFMLAI